MIPQNDIDFADYLNKCPTYKNISDNDKRILSLLINTPGHVRRDRDAGDGEEWNIDGNNETAGPRYRQYAIEFANRSYPVLKNYLDSPSRTLTLKMIQEDIYLSVYARLTDDERTRVDEDTGEKFMKKRGSGPNLKYEKISENTYKIWIPDSENEWVNKKNRGLLIDVLNRNNTTINSVGLQKYFVIRCNDIKIIEKISVDLAEKYNDNVNGLLRNLSGIIFEVFCVGLCPICNSQNLLCHITKEGDLLCKNGHTAEIKINREQAIKHLENHDYVGFARITDNILYPVFLDKNGKEVCYPIIRKSDVLTTFQKSLQILSDQNDYNYIRMRNNRFRNIRGPITEEILGKIHKIYRDIN